MIYPVQHAPTPLLSLGSTGSKLSTTRCASSLCTRLSWVLRDAYEGVQKVLIGGNLRQLAPVANGQTSKLNGVMNLRDAHRGENIFTKVCPLPIASASFPSIFPSHPIPHTGKLHSSLLFTQFPCFLDPFELSVLIFITVCLSFIVLMIPAPGCTITDATQPLPAMSTCSAGCPMIHVSQCVAVDVDFKDLVSQPSMCPFHAGH